MTSNEYLLKKLEEKQQGYWEEELKTHERLVKYSLSAFAGEILQHSIYVFIVLVMYGLFLAHLLRFVVGQSLPQYCVMMGTLAVALFMSVTENELYIKKERAWAEFQEELNKETQHKLFGVFRGWYPPK